MERKQTTTAPSLDLLTHGLSGAVSGCIALLVWYPLETLRIRIQERDLETNERQFQIMIEKIRKENAIITFLRKNFNTFYRIIELLVNGNIISLYNGLSSALVGTVISQGTYFFSYKFFKIVLNRFKVQKGTIVESILASLFSAIVTSIVSNPIWVFNTRMAKKNAQDMSNLEMVKKILKEEGIISFYRGLIPSLFLTINPVIQFTIYEYMKNGILNLSGNLSSLNIIYISFVSKLITTLMTYPILTIKTLFQANENKSNAEILSILNELVKSNGFSGLYKGISAKITQTLTNNIIMMLSYEKIQEIIKMILLNFLFRPKKKLVFSNF